MSHFVYIVQCKDKTLYTGYTTDVPNRVMAHNAPRNKKGGARYTTSRQPVTLVYVEACSSKSVALKREHAIKQLKRPEKLALICTYAP